MMNRILTRTFLFFIILASAQSRPVALVGGRLIDGFGGHPLANSVIIIENERITAIGTVGALKVPADAEVISTEGMDVLPGLWDCHVHTILLGHSDYAHWDKTYPPRLGSEIMPAAARQLLMAGISSARDLGGPLKESISLRDRINRGEIPGPTLYVAGPFIQHEPYPGTEYFRWGVKGAAGVDCFEHTGLAAAPGYPDDILNALHERTAKMSLGPLFWCPTIEGFINYQSLIENPEPLDDPKNYDGVPPDIAADIKQSIAHPNQLAYYQITPLRAKTVAHKFKQLQDSGVVMLIGTDSGIPMKFHSQSTWHELDAWVNHLGVDSMTAIRAATYWPAVMMKVDKDYGSISEGKFADIIALRGDVLQHIDLLQRVDLIIKHGKRVK